MDDSKSKKDKPSKSTKDKDSLSAAMKTKAHGRTIKNFATRQAEGCNSECRYGRECLNFVDFQIVSKYTEQFWGSDTDAPKLPAQRKESMKSIYETLKGGFDADNKLNFTIFDKMGRERKICEAALLYLIGYIDTPNASDANPQWQLFKRMMAGDATSETLKEFRKSAKGVSKTRQRMSAESFIKGLMVEYFGETVASYVGANPDGTSKNIRVLPYERPRQLYEEYKIHCELQRIPEHNQAKETCFEDVLKSMNKTVKLLGTKGAFPTCDVCNTALEMLRDTKRWDRHQREVVLKFRRLHLKQQQIEREHLEDTKERSRKLDPRTGIPREALIFTDAMTSSRGNTPKHGVGRHSKQGKTILNRVFGTQVICGPVEFIMYTSVDQLVMGGANLAIEIQRLAMEKLSIELEKRQLLMPKIMNFQFDNCGENKNKEMFCYASLLVELGYFDTFNINFLVVGHTHCNLDQNFSVLSNKIYFAEHVCSPLAMKDLLSIAHKDKNERPLYNIQLEVLHDYKEYFKPYINKKIKYYQVPHRFRIRRVCGRAIWQYMLFSPDKVDLTDRVDGPGVMFLPLQPAGFDQRNLGMLEERASATNGDVIITQLGIVNGPESLRSELRLNTTLADSTPEDRILAVAYERTIDDLFKLELTALSRQFSRMELQRIGDESINSADELHADTVHKADIQSKMVALATQQYGFIIWLDFSEADPEALLLRPPILPNLDEIVDLEDVDLEQLNENGAGPKLPVNVKIANGAKTIAAVARSMLELKTKNLIQIADEYDERPIHLITSMFTVNILTKKEIDYFEKHKHAYLVLQHLRKAQTEALRQEWEWVRLPQIDPQLLDALQKEIVAKEREIIAHCKQLLVRLRQGRSNTTEVVARPGNLDPDAVAAAAEAIAKLCLASQEDENFDCGGIGPYTICSECNARVCSLHGPEHSKHTYWATEDRLANHIARLTTPREIPPVQPVTSNASARGRGSSRGGRSGRPAGGGRGGRGRNGPQSQGANVTNVVPQLAISRMTVEQLKAELETVHRCNLREIQRHKGIDNLKLLVRLKRQEMEIRNIRLGVVQTSVVTTQPVVSTSVSEQEYDNNDGDIDEDAANDDIDEDVDNDDDDDVDDNNDS